MKMNAEEHEIYLLGCDMYEAWVTEGIHREIISDKVREWCWNYFQPYIDKLEYKLYGPRGHPDFDYQYQQQLLEEE
jgi:hypothetical protein|tara:strand:- start:46 stop:273 length:228 start_codon:yes stop_codon:yes gene_type:complete